VEEVKAPRSTEASDDGSAAGEGGCGEAPGGGEATAPAPAPPGPETLIAASAPAAVVQQAAAEAAAQGPQHITIDDFAKVELRVAQILVAERVPKADKLLRLEVDLGTRSGRFWPGSRNTTSRKS
jgi:methionyl-tRNA synthetase